MQSQIATSFRKLPVVMLPPNVNFFLDDPSTHKQVLTLYNPYDFPIGFKVLCTAPNKYKVVDPEGTIKARHCVDIVIRHTSVVLSNCNVVDKFRIQMLEYLTKQAIGKRDIEAKLLPGTKETFERSTPDPDMFQQLPINENRQQQSYALITQNKEMERGTNYIALIAGIMCMIGLLLPTDGEQNNRVPDYLHPSINLKLIFAFVLGMVTIIILRL